MTYAKNELICWDLCQLCIMMNAINYILCCLVPFCFYILKPRCEGCSVYPYQIGHSTGLSNYNSTATQLKFRYVSVEVFTIQYLANEL